MNEHLRIAAFAAAALALAACKDEAPPSNAPVQAANPIPVVAEPAPGAAGTAATPSPAGASVGFVEPADGATVTSPVRVVFGLVGMAVAPAGTQAPDSGHHHVLVDDPAVDLSAPLPASAQVVHFGAGQTETQLELAPGQHTLQLVFADYRHQPHSPAVVSPKITITVQAAP